MNKEKIIKFLSQKYKTKDIVFIGQGSDSIAFKMNDKYIIRFLTNNNNIYEKEKRICDFVKNFVSIEIPEIKIIRENNHIFSKHKMIKGNSWSWHSFCLNRKKQKNLAESLAKFMAELHSVPVTKFQKDVQSSQYIDIYKIIPYIRKYLTKHQLKLLIKKYELIINKEPNKSDMVLCHLGIKPANSVIDENASITGVFDFGNSGIYERWRDLAVIYSFRNYHLYKLVARAYMKYTGIKVDHTRVADLAHFEWLSKKRWYQQNKFIPQTNDRYLSNVLATNFGCFYKLPRFLYRTILFETMLLRKKLNNKI